MLMLLTKLTNVVLVLLDTVYIKIMIVDLSEDLELEMSLVYHLIVGLNH